MILKQNDRIILKGYCLELQSVYLGTSVTLIFPADSARESLIHLTQGWACNVWRIHLWLYKYTPLTHWDRDKMNAISQTTFSSACSWMKMWGIPTEISLKFVPKDPINNTPALVQIIAWRRPGDKPLSESMAVSSLTHICVTQPQGVNTRCIDKD